MLGLLGNCFKYAHTAKKGQKSTWNQENDTKTNENTNKKIHIIKVTK